MAASPAQQRRYQAALRRVRDLYRAEDEDKYQRYLAQALAEYDDAHVHHNRRIR